MSDAQAALKKIDLDWATHIEKIWETLHGDVSALQQNVRNTLNNALEVLQNSKSHHSPTGFVLVGQAGSGKTHFLRYVRQQCLSRHMTFILVDMTGVNNFWETVLQGYLNSLQQPLPPDNISQAQQLISCLFHPLPLKKLEELEADKAAKFIRLRTEALLQRKPAERARIQRFKDVFRAFVLLNTHEGENTGYNWLQGLTLDADEKKQFGFARAAMPPKDIVEGLSWLTGMCGSCVLAFDQMDSLVSQQRLLSPEPGALTNSEISKEQRAAKAIIEDIAGGLMSLRDVSSRTLSLVACLEPTWNMINEYSVASVQARFHAPQMLSPVLEPLLAEQLIAARLQQSYAASDFTPDYPTWPLEPTFFEQTGSGGLSPRQVLQRCHQRIQDLLSSETPQNSLDAEFEAAQKTVDISKLLNQYGEDEGLGGLLQTAADCLLIENPSAPEIDAEFETQFQEVSKSPVLHGRIRLIFPDGQEKHLCLRAMQRENARAYQNRLKAAMTASGIDRALTFRRLLLIRSPSRAIPGGQVTTDLMQTFAAAGGILAHPTNNELRVLGALQTLRDKPEFKSWLTQRRLVSRLSFLQDIVPWLFSDLPGQPSSALPQQHRPADVPTTATRETASPIKQTASSPQPQAADKLPAQTTAQIPLGVFVRNHKPTDETVVLPLEQLTRHSVVLAGSGSGKTVLLKRLIEEAALQGIPAIVLDIGGDLVRLGEAWSQPSLGQFDHEAAKMARFYQHVETLIWTPGKESGLPLILNPLPDFSAVRNDPEEFDSAIDMARDSLEALVITGKGKAVERAVLRNTLEYFARQGGDNLRDLADLLRDLAPEAWGDFGEQAHKLAQKMADLLSAALTNHALLRQRGTPLDPAVLFGFGQNSRKTRLSVISLSGLSSLEAQQQFVNQLAMTLFTWIKQHPSAQLNGLFVLDEAKDFIPSQSNTPCKAALTRLAAQARKYGLGLIFASQAPKSIDHNIIANCSTQLYGKTNSPTAKNAALEMLKQHGGDFSDLGALEKGRFYLVTENTKPARKIATPLCFSNHEGALDESEILRRAAECRKSLSGK